MTTVKMVKLGTLIKPAKLQKCGNDNYPVLSMTMHNGLVFQSDKFKKSVASQDKSTYKVVHRNQLVIGFPIDEGVLATQRITDAGIVSPAYGIWDVDQTKIIPEFLEYALRCNRAIDYYKAKLRGSTARRRSLPTPTLLELDVPLPDIEQQKLALTTIHHAKNALDSRQAQLTKLDELVKARFVEMFENNTYPKVKVSTVCDFITKGTTPPNDLISEEYSSDKVPYLKVYNLSFNGELLFDTAPQYISENIHNGMLARSKVYPNDVLMNIVGPPLGKFSLVTDEFPEWNINQAIAIFRAKEKINPKYLLSALMQPEVLNPFLRQAVGIRQLNLSLSQCRDLEIFLPPLSLQNQFSAFVAEVDKSKLFVGSAAAHKPFDIGFFSQKHCATPCKRGIISSKHMIFH
jgi:type I restriction enzyme S subunit